MNSHKEQYENLNFDEFGHSMILAYDSHTAVFSQKGNINYAEKKTHYLLAASQKLGVFVV